MFIVYKAYDDKSAEIIDIITYSKREMGERELIAFSKNHNVLGLSVSNNKINYITAYSFMQFPTEADANEYCHENGYSYQQKMYIGSYYYVFEKTNKTYHVDYYVMYWTEVEQTYLAEKGYTPYIQCAKSFDKKSAYERAASMTKNSKTGKKWSVYRYVNLYQ